MVIFHILSGNLLSVECKFWFSLRVNNRVCYISEYGVLPTSNLGPILKDKRCLSIANILWQGSDTCFWPYFLPSVISKERWLFMILGWEEVGIMAETFILLPGLCFDAGTMKGCIPGKRLFSPYGIFREDITHSLS